MTEKNTSYPNMGTGYFFEGNTKKDLTNRERCAAALLILKISKAALVVTGISPDTLQGGCT